MKRNWLSAMDKKDKEIDLTPEVITLGFYSLNFKYTCDIKYQIIPVI